MDVLHAMKMYINQMVDDAGHGIKALLMDKETVKSFFLQFSFKILFWFFFSIQTDKHHQFGLCPIGNVTERGLPV